MAGVLGPLLVQNAVEAAPAVVIRELGKLALVGASAVGSGAAAVGVSTSASAATVGVLAGIKAKVVTVAAVAVIGVGGVVTYQQVSNRPERGTSVEQRVPEEAPAAIGSRREEQGQISRTATVVKPEASLADTGDLEQDERPEDVRIAISEPEPDVVDDVEREDAPAHEDGPVYVMMSYARPRSEPNGEDEGAIPDTNGPAGGN